MPPAHARRCRPAGLPAGSAGAAVPSYRLPRCRAAAGTPGPAWVRLVTRTAGISRARAPAPLPPPCRRTLNPGPPHPGPDQATMELSPSLLLLLLAALLPLAAWSGPTARPAGKQERGTVKPGYCYHNAEVEDLLAEDCGSCRTDTSSPHCTGDASCPGATKCCPSKCGYTCQDPVMDFCYLPSVCGNCKALFRRFFFNTTSHQCEEFIYGGCGGNRNNFKTESECFQACSHAVPGAG
ncbi:kunitz-type protease inhibitor 4 isoform X2 [Columba livia]|uniref:kunitz-type protease inhibitor 4 isoform X2 n=1 Tax=Columba livia TaxID=8932 RepID=UPI0031BA9AF8